CRVYTGAVAFKDDAVRRNPDGSHRHSIADRSVVVSALRSTFSSDNVNTRRAVDALSQPMEVSRAPSWPFPGECNAGCGIFSDDQLRSRGDCDASDDRSNSSDERAERAKGKY